MLHGLQVLKLAGFQHWQKLSVTPFTWLYSTPRGPQVLPVASGFCRLRLYHINLNILFGEPRATSFCRGTSGPASGIPTLARTTLRKIFAQLVIGVACRICAVSSKAFRDMLRHRETVEARGLTFQLVDSWRRQPQTADAFRDPLLPRVSHEVCGKNAGRVTAVAQHVLAPPRRKIGPRLPGPRRRLRGLDPRRKMDTRPPLRSQVTKCSSGYQQFGAPDCPLLVF